jgi:hypothetical protein
MDNSIILNIYNKYVSFHGIKPRNDEIIYDYDSINMIIKKFIKWYNRAYEFAITDPRDFSAFCRINNEFLNIYNSLINNDNIDEINNNIFIKIMLEYINKNNPHNVIFPNYIINIINIKIINEIIQFDISNMIGNIINNDIILDLNSSCIDLYEKIFSYDILGIINITQLKIIYNNNLINYNNILLNTLLVFEN